MNPYLLISIELGPDLVGRIFNRLPADAIDKPSGPDRFTPREVVAHLADWEPEFFERMQTANAEPGAPIKVYDEGEWAIEHRYAEADPLEQIALFRKRRAESAAFLRELDSDSFELHVMHPESGRRTIADMANMLLGHDLYHIEQLFAAFEQSYTKT